MHKISLILKKMRGTEVHHYLQNMKSLSFFNILPVAWSMVFAKDEIRQGFNVCKRDCTKPFISETTVSDDLVAKDVRVEHCSQSEEWCNFILLVEEGTENAEDAFVLLAESVQVIQNEDELCSFAFQNSDFIAKDAILAPTNDMCSKIIGVCLRFCLMDNHESSLLSLQGILETESENARSEPSEFLNTTNKNRLHPHKLCLKVEAPIICLRKLNKRDDFQNGRRTTIAECYQPRIETRIITEDPAFGRTILMPRMKTFACN